MKNKTNISEKLLAFDELLNLADPEKLSTETYCRKYLGHLLKHKRYYLAIYADVLEKLLSHSGKKIHEIILIDLGAGNGMLGLFAKFCGFKKVYINDVDEKFVHASQNLAQQLMLCIDGFITGDIHAIQSWFKNEVPDAIVGTDVIEHIYNPDDLFSTLQQINPLMISVFTTASNPRNYFKVRQLKKLHLKDEYTGGEPDDFVLFGASPLEAFLTTRQTIIRSQIPRASEETILQLSKATRGMNQPDIISAVKKYETDYSVPVPAHPTNTCNPLTGSWTERILSLEAYSHLYQNNGMKLEIFNGFYDVYKKGPRKLLNKLLNLAILALGGYFAPYIIFVGTKN